jgi:GNAT superfamily N-acetyltransferase
MNALEAARRADDAEARAFADLYAAAPPALQQRLGLAVHRVADATVLLAPGLPTPMFNRAIGLGLALAANTAALAAIEAAYAQAGVRAWWLHWNPLAAPADFASELTARGYAPAPRRRWAKMLRTTDSAPHATTSLEVVAADATIAPATTRAIAAAFEMPPFMADWLLALHGRAGWQLLALRDGDQVVGGGCLHVAGDTAWLGMGGVLASHRRRGGQRALLARRIAEAGRAGARWAVTETGLPVTDEPNPSLANIRAAGFACVAERCNYAGPTA